MRWPGGLAALAGIAAAAGQVPVSLVPLGLAALALAAWLAMTAPTARRAAWIGFVAGTGYFGATLHWIVQPFLVDIETYGWMAPFGLFFTATGFALFWALAFGIARRVAEPGWRFALAFAAALAGVEATRSLILTGFPWSLLGYMWSEGPGAQLGAGVGPFGLTLLTALLAGGIAAVARHWATGLALATLAWVAVIGAGSLRPPPPPVPEGAPLVRLIQPNAPQDQKWDPERSGEFFRRGLDLTAAAGDPDLIVWPETSVPYLLEPGHGAIEPLTAAAGGVPLVVGAQRVEGSLYYNALLVISPEGRIAETYDKHHLVPFGEYVPFSETLAQFGIRGIAQSQGFGYSAGPGPRLVDLGRAGTVLPLICYEAIFPEEVAAAPARPDWLLQITNDAWFGRFAGPQQHLAIARMRAIEQGLPLMRAANTGISAAVDAHGRVVASLPLGQAGALDVPLPAALPPTIYARIGDGPVYAVMLLCLLAAGVGGRRRAVA